VDVGYDRALDDVRTAPDSLLPEPGHLAQASHPRPFDKPCGAPRISSEGGLRITTPRQDQ
jgi:hypothetical protein